jgi:hypothetical protein
MLVVMSSINPWLPCAFIILLLTTSAGAETVVATVPAKAEATKCRGMPSDMRLLERMRDLKIS